MSTSNRPPPIPDPNYYGDPKDFKPWAYDPLKPDEHWSADFTVLIEPLMPMYIERAKAQYQCKRCGALTFEVFSGSYWTGIRCVNCLWEQCVHEG